MKSTTALVAVFVLGFMVATTLAHEGHDHKLMGTVTLAAADRLTLNDSAGKEVTVRVSPTTRIKSAKRLKVEEIRAGTRVVITATVAKDGTITAKVIEVGVASMPQPRPTG